MTDRVTIYDTALRDGCQGTGIHTHKHPEVVSAGIA